MRYQITTQIEHIPTELGESGYARLAFLVNGDPIAYQNFSVQYPTGEDVKRTIWSLAYSLYFNRHFSEYHDALYPLAFPCSE